MTNKASYLSYLFLSNIGYQIEYLKKIKRTLAYIKNEWHKNLECIKCRTQMSYNIS